MTFFARIRLVTFVLILLGIAVAPLSAQKLGPDGAPNPDASVTDQRMLLDQAPRIQGRIDIPDVKASVLIQPAGRTWDYFHEVLLHWGGAIVIVGTIAVLALAYLIIGRIRIAAGRSGEKILRFKAFERFSHWLTANGSGRVAASSKTGTLRQDGSISVRRWSTGCPSQPVLRSLLPDLCCCFRSTAPTSPPG